ncbi:MASE4 domain-containing protein [Bradyrhizobium altum]|uniref:MASE4 domain-containing protein n=1 Tax=Bradyrhizobium altum TaxID=1571202 RepID=UPI0024BF744E|nr:MASE4 domain-containing protein [Bradyrhizobium altum]
MSEAIVAIPEEQDLLLSTLSPGPAQKRLALAVVAGFLVAVFIIVGPLSTIPPFRVDAFVPAYSAAMFVIDAITAILLFNQFVILRSTAILVIASGYLYGALIEIPWILTFPGVFASTGLVGGLQSTVWLYFFWHIGFPMFVIGYALLKEANPTKRLWYGTMRSAITLSVILTAVLVAVLAFLCVADETRLPRVMLDDFRFGPQWPFVAGPVALLSISALFGFGSANVRCSIFG